MWLILYILIYMFFLIERKQTCYNNTSQFSKKSHSAKCSIPARTYCFLVQNNYWTFEVRVHRACRYLKVSCVNDVRARLCWADMKEITLVVLLPSFPLKYIRQRQAFPFIIFLTRCHKVAGTAWTKMPNDVLSRGLHFSILCSHNMRFEGFIGSDLGHNMPPSTNSARALEFLAVANRIIDTDLTRNPFHYAPNLVQGLFFHV